MSDFLPEAEDQRVIWLTQFKAKLASYKAELGLAGPKLTEAENLCDTRIDALNAKDVAAGQSHRAASARKRA